MGGFPNIDIFISFGFYLSVLAIIFLYLSINVSSARRDLKIPIGDGNNIILQRAIRAHANFCEYVPFSIIIILIISQITSPIDILTRPMGVMAHVLFVLLIAGRLCHLYGMLFVEARVEPRLTWRCIGSGLTLCVIALSALVLLINWVYMLAQTL